MSVVASLGETLNEDVKAVVELKNLDDRIEFADGLVREVVLASGNDSEMLNYTFVAK